MYRASLSSHTVQPSLQRLVAAGFAYLAGHATSSEETSSRSYFVPMHVAGYAQQRVRSFAELAEKVQPASKKPKAPVAETPVLLSGWFGYCCYEAASELHPELALPAPAVKQVPPVHFVRVDAVLVHDHHLDTWSICSSTQVEGERLQQAVHRELSKRPVAPAVAASSSRDSIYPLDQDQQTFEANVTETIQRILAGDLFQANITRQVCASWPGAGRADALGFAERLVTQAQATFGAILPLENAIIASASPERFFRAEQTAAGTQVVAEPVKGTRPRQDDPDADAQVVTELLASEKDRAENIMIADLVRNDLSKVCTDKSVRAKEVCEVQSNRYVHHLVSRITGVLRPDQTIVEAFKAQFPCGSITGAPKLAAMDLIAELEGEGRGIYCGAIGYLDDRGHADFSIAIRTAVLEIRPNSVELSYGTGGGITTLSDPAEEWHETVDKAASFLRALTL